MSQIFGTIIIEGDADMVIHWHDNDKVVRFEDFAEDIVEWAKEWVERQ